MIQNISSATDLTLLVIIIIALFYRRAKTGGNLIGILNCTLLYSILAIVTGFIGSIYPGFTFINNLSMGLSMLVILPMIFLFASSIYQYKVGKAAVISTYLCILVLAIVLGFISISSIIFSVIASVLTLLLITLIIWYYFLHRQKSILFFIAYIVLITTSSALVSVSVLYAGISSAASYIFLGIAVLMFSASQKGGTEQETVFGSSPYKTAKLRPRIFLTYGAIFLMIMTITTFFSARETRNLIESQAKNNIITLTSSRATNIETYITDQKKFISSLAASQILRDYLNNLTPSQKEESKLRLARTKLTDPNLLELSVLDAKGDIVLSTDSANEGMDKSQDPYFTQAQSDIYFKDVNQTEVTGQISYTLSGPIKDDATGNTVGVVVGHFRPDGFYTILTDRTGIGNTGENIIVNRQKYFLSPSHFLGDTVVLKDTSDTANTQRCFDPLEIQEKSENEVYLYNDYRNVPVVGAHRYIAQTDWCVVGKIDQSEVFAPAQRNVWILILLSLIGFALVSFVSYFVALRITRPIENLQKGAEEIVKGDFDYKVATKDQDEIGQLSRTFEKMTSAILESRSEIDQKVKEQTKEIIQKSEDLSNQQKALLNIMEDIEEEKAKAGAERDKSQTIIQSIGDGVIVVDKEGKIILANPQTETMLGYKIEEMINHQLDDLIPIFDANDKLLPNDKRPINQILKTGVKTSYINLAYQRKDKTKLPIALTNAPIKLKDHLIGAVDVFRDITQERQVDKAKTEFVSLASHQLRTPLSAVNWYTEMLLAGDAGKISPDQKKYLEEVYHGNQRMIDLVNALLNVSRLELGTFVVEPESVKIPNLAKSVIEELKPQIDQKKISFSEKFDQIPTIKADPKLLRIVFQNLLSNAVKYTPEKGKVVLSMKSLKKDDTISGHKITESSILISIADNGFGIPEKQKDKIFTKLFRADNVREKDTEGTGLGLYIVKAIIDQAKGQVWFESKENKGTTFLATLPISGMTAKEGTRTID